MATKTKEHSQQIDLKQYQYVPVLCVVGYNRPRSLERVLSSIERSNCPEGVKMVISIDRAQPDNPDNVQANQETLQLAHDFEWRGEKEVIYRDRNVRLPDHIIICADMAEEYGAVMIIEDDLYLAPDFYRYALEATNFYAGDERIAGVGMYTLVNNSHTHHLPFNPFQDGSTTFFAQHPCSWGQIWTREQWREFRSWWDQKTGFSAEDLIPEGIKSWGNQAWDNHFFKFLYEKGRYFVYPRVAYSTNFVEAGTHFEGEMAHHYQAVLQTGTIDFKFLTLDESLAKYDPYLDIEAHSVKRMAPALAAYDFVVDLNGIKQLAQFQQKYVLTLKEGGETILSYGWDLKPFEMNLLYDLPGDQIRLVEKSALSGLEAREPIKLYDYFYKNIPIKALIRLLSRRIKARMKKG
jgi:hypothetical protein